MGNQEKTSGEIFTPSIILIFKKKILFSFDIFFWSESNNSLIDYLRSELRRGYVLQNDEQRYKERRDKFYISLQIPFKLEKVNFFVSLFCKKIL